MTLNNSFQKSPTGLSPAEVEQARAQHGWNELPSAPPVSAFQILINQFKSPLVYIILTAALVSLIMGELGDFAIIMLVILIDAALGFWQELRAQRTYEALKGLLKPTTTVLRDGQRVEIEARELVPGDIALLTAGERVPGDGALVESTKLLVDEAILTGESEAVTKSGNEALFMGTTVLNGHALMRVSATGAASELGKIAVSSQEKKEEDTPLQQRMAAFSRTLTRIVIGFTGAILLSGMLMGQGFLEMLRTAIILAIAAVPEGLLIAVTVIMVLGMRKILKRSALVKRLLAVETLGSVTVICTDKTGTLTEGRMRVDRVEVVDETTALQVLALCNNLEGAVDAAVWEYAAQQLKADPQTLADGARRTGEELFSSETKFMAVSALLDGKETDYLKGAPEIVLEMCALPAVEKASILKTIDLWASDGLRLLGLATRAHQNLETHSGYSWVGLLGMQDPLREGVLEAVRTAQHAGITVKMITGDYRLTAERIARNVGIMRDGDEILEGAELNGMTDEELASRVGKVAVFARIRPQEKLRIVRALQVRHEITAMIGDGVNDAPALNRANIGVVVGSATDVAKETADVILMDSNFRTIVAAVEEGRVIFENIRKVVAYTLSNSFAEVLAIFTAMLLGWPAPLLVGQILWIHLICDGPADIVLGFEPKENGIMDEKPKPVSEPILPRLSLGLITAISTLSAAAALLLFGWFAFSHGDAAEGRSIVFASFALNSMIYIFAYRSLRQPLWKMPPLSQNKPLVYSVAAGIFLSILPFLVPALRELLGLVPLNPAEWLLVAGVALGLLGLVEVAKQISWKIERKR